MTAEEKQMLTAQALGMLQGARIGQLNMFVESGAKVVYQEMATTAPRELQVSDEQMAAAITAINGKGKVLNKQNLWVAVCCLLGWKYGYPRNLGACCERIQQLPLQNLEVECKYESIRKYGTWAFVREDARHWDTYEARSDERFFFNDCLGVARALDAELHKTTG